MALCRAATMIVGLLLAVACDAPAPESTPKSTPTASASEQRSPVEVPAPPQAATCTDWSKAELGTLPALPQSRHRRTFEQAWKLVLDKHFDPTLGCLDWPKLRVRYGEKLAQTRDQTEAFAVINEMLDELGQSHVRLFSGGSDEAVGPAAVDLQLRWIGDALVVVDAPKDSPVKPGSVVKSVGEASVESLVAKAHARSERPSERAFTIARLAHAKLSCSSEGPIRNVVLEGDEVVGLPCVASQGETMSLGNLTDVPTRVEHRMIGQVGVLAFNVWMLPMVPKIEAALADLRAQGMEALVLDLRGNPGGVGPMAVSVARSLLREPGSLGKLEMRDFTQEFNVTPRADAFAGPIALLVDEGTASTSEIFAAGMRDLERVTIYGGRASAGAALPSLIEQLDDGALFQYIVGDYHSPKGVLIEGRGVQPDHVVPETAADFAAGKDPVLEAALADLRGA